MIVRKKRTPYFKELLTKRNFSIINRYYRNWIKKTFIRIIAVVILCFIVLAMRFFNFDSSQNALNLIKEKLEYTASIQSYILTIKTLPKKTISLGEKAIEAIKIEDDLDNRFIVPVEGEIITYFNENIGEAAYVSKGIIFTSNVGEDVYSVDNGVVIDVGSNKFVGNYIIIKHKGELLSVYKYLGENSVYLNQSVEKGQIIGSSSERLLLEIWFRNEAIDPMQYMNLSTEQI